MEHASYQGTSTRGERPYEFSPNGPVESTGIPQHTSELQTTLLRLHTSLEALEKQLEPVLTPVPPGVISTSTPPIGTDGRRSLVADAMMQARYRVEDLIICVERLRERVEL